MSSENIQHPDSDESPKQEDNLEPEQQAQRDADEREKRLDDAIEMTFPASDPIAI